jgi:uncharacterized caspase-like protein
MAGQRRALIVANGEYDNAGLQRLMSPAADADALADVLANRTISDFDVRVVRNETAHVVQAEIEDLFAEGKPDDVLLLHFSCHGLKSDSGELFFAARNTRPDRLGSTAVPAEFVQRCMRVSRSRSIVLLLDCCYGGAFGQGVAVRASGDANVLDNFPGSGFGGRGRAVITASNSIEYAFEGDRLAAGQAQPSVFTAALVEGLRTGEADRDEDGWIALGELYEYLFDRVRERNPKQTPSRDIEMQGELYLARSRRRKIKPSPIPADLQSAIAAENMFARLGAVAELRRRLGSENLPVAMGAFEALKTMAATDIEHVADAAEAAREHVAVRTDVSVLRFDADPVVRRIRLLGPPVARACTFESSHGWIVVEETDDGAEVTVTAAESVKRQGKIVVTGPTGEAVVTVEAAAGEPVAAPEPVVRAEPEVAPQPEVEPVSEPVVPPTPKPVGDAVVPSIPKPVAGPVTSGVGLLAVVGGVLALANMAFEYHYNLSDYSYKLAGARPGLEWYVWLLAPLAMIAGGLVAVPRIQARAGGGWLAGIGAAALWGLLVIYDFGKSFTSGSSGQHLAAGFAFLFLGLLAVVVAGTATFWVFRGEARLGRPREPYLWIGVGLGVFGAVALFVQYSEGAGAGSSRYEGSWRAFVFVAVLTVAVPLLAVLIRSQRFGGQLLVGWACGGLTILLAILRTKLDSSSVPVTWALLFGASLVLLGILGGFAMRNQPIGRQS